MVSWNHDDDYLLDAAATCCQFRPLCSDMDETNESLRECLKLNVCQPLRARIAELEAALRELLATARHHKAGPKRNEPCICGAMREENHHSYCRAARKAFALLGDA